MAVTPPSDPTLTIRVSPMPDDRVQVKIVPHQMPGWMVAHEALLASLSVVAQQVGKGQRPPQAYLAALAVLRELAQDIQAAAPMIDVVQHGNGLVT